MKSVRNKYHYGVSKCQANADKVRRESSIRGDTNLLKEKKRIRGDTKLHSMPSETVDGVSGLRKLAKWRNSELAKNCVNEACSSMKPGKADVTGSYTSDNLLHGPDYLFDLFAGVFRSFLIHGDVTLELLSCAFIPLYKGASKIQC